MIKRVLADIRRLLQKVDQAAPHWALVLLAAGGGAMFMELSRVVGLYGTTGRVYSILVYVITAGAAVVDYAATSLDVAIQAYANVNAEIRRFAVTGRLPLFAIATAPKTADTIKSIKDLEGKTVGINQLGTADYALTLYLLKQAGADA